MRASAAALGLLAAFGFGRFWFRRVMARRTLAAREQLRALRAQLNPHFLFNVLHSLSVLVRSDPALAERALEHLGAMLRYVLDDGLGDEVELAEELGFVEHYPGPGVAALRPPAEDTAGGGGGGARRTLPPSPCSFWSKRGSPWIARVPEGGTVEIRAFQAGARLTLAVKDDGPGTTPENALGAEGLGLRALRQRLQARYAGRAELELVTAPGAGFQAKVVLPQERAREAV